MLSGISTILNIGLLYLFSFFLGYLILLWVRPRELLNFPFFVKLPVYLTLGLLTVSILLFIIGLVRVSGYTFILMTLFSLPILYYQLKSKSGIKIKIKTNFISLDTIMPAALFILTFLYFSNVIAIFGWPPSGDVFYHGLYTSVLVCNQKVGFTLAPYSPSVLLAPMLTLSGLHALSATLSMLTGVFPGEAVFIVGGAIVILIPLLLYSLTYILTRSKLLSLLVFLSTFLIGPGLEQWVFGYFYNGPYPTLFGILAILLFLTHSVASAEIQVERKLLTRRKALTLLIILGVLLVYPAFIIFSLLYLLVSTLYYGKIPKTIQNIKMTRRNVLLLSLFSAITILFVASSMATNQEFLSQMLQEIILRLSKVYGRHGYAVYTPIFYTSVIGIAILVAGVISIFFVVKRLYARLALFYLIVLIPVMLSLHPHLFPIFSFILPERSLMICSLLSWVLISLLISHVFANSKHVLTRLRFKNRLYTSQINHGKVVTVALIILLVFTPSLFSNFTFEPAHKYSWLMRHGFANDYDVLLWVHKNVQLTDLILNDNSWTSWYIPSFSIKNVTSKYFLDSDYERNRAIEVQHFWRNPNDIDLFLKLAEDHNISYVLVTSERGYFNWSDIGGDNSYVSKPYTPAQYKAIFNDNPCLELLFEKGDAGVYKVKSLGRVEYAYALEFDGVDDHIRVEHSESLMPSTQVSIAVWIKPNGLPAIDSFVLSKKRHTDDGYELSWRWNKRFAFNINSDLQLQSSKVFGSADLEKWWHIVAVYDGSKAYLYINGELDASANYSKSINPNNMPLGIGCRCTTDPCYFTPSHVLDEVRVYNRALSQSEAEQLYRGDNTTSNVVLYLPIDEGQGSLLHDQSGYYNHGIIFGPKFIQYAKLIVDSVVYRRSR